MTTICSRPAVLRGPIGERVLQPGRFLVALNLLNRGLADVHDRQTVLVASKDLVADQAAAAPAKARLRRPARPRQPRPRGSDAGPFVPTQSRRGPCVRGASSSKSTRADRSLRDPSQRANADSAWNPILGDSPRSVKL